MLAVLTIAGAGGGSAAGSVASTSRPTPPGPAGKTPLKAKGGKPRAGEQATPGKSGTIIPKRKVGNVGEVGASSRRDARAKGATSVVARTATKTQSRARGKAKGPTRAAAIPPARGRVVVFAFKGDEAASEVIRARVVRALRAKGLKVTTTLRPVDSAEQYREMAVALDLAAYVDGNVSEDGDQASATVHVRSGVTGLRVASATFAGERRKLPSEIGKTLWDEVGPTFSRVCAEAAKPRKLERAPMRIEAGTPIESRPRDAQEEEGT